MFPWFGKKPPTDDVAEERAANVASIQAIPADELPDQEARAELMRRAAAGMDVCAYWPACSPTSVVWVRQEGRPDLEARFTPMEWARQWRAGMQPVITRRGGVK